MVHQTKNSITAWLVPFGLALLAVAIFSCQQETVSMEQMKVYQGPIMEVDSLETLFSDSAILRVKFKAGKQLEYQTGDKEFLNGVRVEFYNETGKEEAVLTSQKGYQEKVTGLYRVEGDVVVQNIKEKKELHTEKLFWDPNKKRIYTPEDEFVKIQTPLEILQGHGMEANQDFSWYKLKKPSGIKYLTE